ncbi:DUF7311 family protein [Halobaculum sp. D14]|uniref:DUF7311 family protein n=1 Tax=Halobaculum sp. D14 TaxID=3421642 RepID=UPI003EC0EE3A
MIRVVLAVAVTAALLAASLPVIESVSAERTAAELDRATVRLDRAAADLLSAESAVDAGRRGARRTVGLRLPARSLVAAPVRFVALCPGRRATVRYAVGRGPTVTRRLSTPMAVEGVTAGGGGGVTAESDGGVTADDSGGALVFTEPGAHLLTLEVTHREGNGRRVVVSASESSSTGTGPPRPCGSQRRSDGTSAPTPAALATPPPTRPVAVRSARWTAPARAANG